MLQASFAPPATRFRWLPVRGTHVATRPLGPQLQALQAIEPMDPLAIDLPALTPQQHVNASVAVPNTGGGNLPDPPSQRFL
jgi:hypothetical protein